MKDTVQSVERTLSILEVLSDYSEGLGVTDISEKVELHKSTVYRLLSTLINKDYVTQDKETNRYKITFKLYELGNKRIEKMNILSASKLYSKKLMESVNEVVHLVVREGNKIVYIDKVEANNTIRMASSIGKRSPMYCTSVGKAILAYLPVQEVEEVWNISKVEKLTKYTITNFEDLKRELNMVKEKGYAIDNEENEMGVRCVGAPIFNRFGEIEGAISISGPAIRITDEKLETMANEVIKHANLISMELGYTEA
ncbi:MAG: IclR family transcriptional regulator [Clostridia bacterium BRH_c25]|nr:MAG: IclR family transcriptional regulator [Clostridia bacterium BRH_c25]